MAPKRRGAPVVNAAPARKQAKRRCAETEEVESPVAKQAREQVQQRSRRQHLQETEEAAPPEQQPEPRCFAPQEDNSVAEEGEEAPAQVYLMKDEHQIAAIHNDPGSFPAVTTTDDWRSRLCKTRWPSTRRTAGADGGKHAVFCFGSNGVAQLRERVRNPRLTSAPATLPNAERVFGGWSKRWGGAVASIVPSFTGRAVRGSVALLTKAELELLDGFEGVDPCDAYGRSGVYRRQDLELRMEDGRTLPAVAYVKNSLKWLGPPSEAYLAACREHLLDFWDGEDAAVDVRDGTGELRQ